MNIKTRGFPSGCIQLQVMIQGYIGMKKNEYSKEAMLFITASMCKSVFGKFDYGHKLRSSQSKKIKLKVYVQLT